MTMTAPIVSCHLPAELNSFIGRRHEIAEVKRLLSDARLVTLIGVGGVGKTRLAQRVGFDLRRSFADGVWLVELAALESPELLVQAVMECLEIQDRSLRPPIEVLTEHLRDKRMLLILDNCEHLLDECAAVAETLMRAAPDLRILATSRQTLGVVGEQVMPVPPLPLPDFDVARSSTDSLKQFDAIRLFADRSQSVLPGFEVTDDNQDSVARIVRRLDGIPLAIELAAVRLRALSVEQLLARLDDRFRLLTMGARTAMPRQQTLRALIDWSYALCTEQERLLWARLSVFSGGLDLEAAEHVCAGDGIEPDEVVDLVVGLVGKSVLAREGDQTTVRYRLLETIRQYGRDRLRESGDEAALRARHRDWFADLASRGQREWFGPDQVAWFNRLRAEHGNIRSALDYCLTTPGEAVRGLAIATALRFYWIATGSLREPRDWLDRLLAAGPATGPAARPPAGPVEGPPAGPAAESAADSAVAPAVGPPVGDAVGDAEEDAAATVRANALCVNARLAVLQSDFALAADMLEEARELAKQLDDAAIVAEISYVCGLAALLQRDITGAAALLEEAVAGYRETDAPMGVVNTLLYLATAHSLLGHPEEAVARFKEGLEACEAREDHWFRSYTLWMYGVEVWREGDVAGAVEMEREAIRLKQPFDDRLGTALCIEALAWMAADGTPERAAVLFGASQERWRSFCAPPFGYLAGHHDASEALARERLGEEKFEAAFRRGTELTPADALAYAMCESPKPAKPAAAAQASPLTRREMEIARLVAQGMTNKAIASALVIAQRTAEGHVEHILTKLGFNSRAQIAAWVSEQGLLPGGAP
ncbi:LuxR C-terminal-related transcriptional regulator [Nonomuraea jabiensis]|uniref:Non-specific serine/threonine protein kinase n=1 Tax=Nonomuraea jabiensis TaxID=882448 RepID=A0A7W9GB16_9ACTN|nr:LuxR C-terminal-related transcriptional regulator [Nonomuraea jabiensis]MBB5780474.1 non-specific serine/threonine protein kinase [Nonomuraea jabiensis]